MSLYDQIAVRPGGQRDLAEARLRRRALILLHTAVEAAGIAEEELAVLAGVRLRTVRKALHGTGDVKISLLAKLLHAVGAETDMQLVDAGEMRRRAARG